MTDRRRACLDVWVCEGRMCVSKGGERLRDVAASQLRARPEGDRERTRVLRGGCFGLCEMSANVIVRRWDDASVRPDPREDRLVATGTDNETIYALVEDADLVELLRSHLDDDRAVDALTLLARERTVPATSATARNLRRLREAARGAEPDPPA